MTKMCQGGIYDHLGGGFARYSVDAEWLVPHFEKMLYDNAALIELRTAVWQETREPPIEARIRQTIGRVLRAMKAGGGVIAGSRSVRPRTGKDGVSTVRAQWEGVH